MKAVPTLLLIVSLTLTAQVAGDEELVAAMNLREGMTVASIGVQGINGLLSQAVGPRGKVISEDVRTVSERANDPRLAVASIDVVLLADHRQFERAEQLLAYLRSAIKPLGQLCIIYPRGPNPAERNQISRQIEANGFDLISTRDLSASQYILTFARP